MNLARQALLGSLAAAALVCSCMQFRTGQVCDASSADPGGCGASSPARSDGRFVPPQPDGPASSPPDAAVSGADPDAVAPGTPDPSPQSRPDGSADPTQDPGCQIGSHRCDGTCVSNSEPSHCGTSCEPCPTITGGTSSCNDSTCGVVCPPDQKACLDACIAKDAPCDGTCPTGKNLCASICVDSTSLNYCGPSCGRCPVSPDGKSSCDGDKCSLQCNSGFHRCGDACLSDKDPRSCGTSCDPCLAPTGGTATCDGVTCGASCPASTKRCEGACIATGQSCNGVCPGGSHDCGGNCVSNSDPNACGQACVRCSNNHRTPVCSNGVCSGGCSAGFADCNGNPADGCEADFSTNGNCGGCGVTCGGNASCVNRKCVIPCPPCRTAPHCDAAGNNVVTEFCDMATGTCRETTKQGCSSGCSNSQCIVCGGSNQACCAGEKCNNPNSLICGTRTPFNLPSTCLSCGTDPQPCCEGQKCNAGNQCDDGGCIKCGTIGVLCCFLPNKPCVAGAVCFGDGICRAPLGPGESCVSDTECASTGCRGQCTASTSRGLAGSSCLIETDCPDGQCDKSNQKCL